MTLTRWERKSYGSWTQPNFLSFKVINFLFHVSFSLIIPPILSFSSYTFFLTYLLAELYHQYHDGFMLGEQYPESYNALAKKAYAQGRLQKTGCPDTNF